LSENLAGKGGTKKFKIKISNFKSKNKRERGSMKHGI
jgi:hypothetical protein